jgi:type IV pilus assembly protein PilV
MRRESGFTLVEVLVALLVLALGMAGGVAMQLHAMRTRYESAQLSNAVQAAAAMADRIRANASQLPDYLTLDYDSSTAGAPAPPSSLCLEHGCDRAQLAALDLYQLQNMVRQRFPTGRARICRDAHMWRDGKVRWDCSGDAGAPVVVKIGWRGKNPDGTPVHFDGLDFAPGVTVAVAGLPR